MGRQEVLEFLHYYVDVRVVPGLVEGLVDVESEKCEVRVVTHQTSFPEYFDLEFCIPINQQPYFDPLLTGQSPHDFIFKPVFPCEPPLFIHLSHIFIHDFKCISKLPEVKYAEVRARMLSESQCPAVGVSVIRYIAQVDCAHPVQVPT